MDDEKIIHQRMHFRFLGIKVSGHENIEKDVRVAACLKNTKWRSKHIKNEDLL